MRLDILSKVFSTLLFDACSVHELAFVWFGQHNWICVGVREVSRQDGWTRLPARAYGVVKGKYIHQGGSWIYVDTILDMQGIIILVECVSKLECEVWRAQWV